MPKRSTSASRTAASTPRSALPAPKPKHSRPASPPDPTRSLGLSKRLLNATFEHGLADSLELEGHFQALATSSPDLVEGMAAFKEKRDARFGGQ